MMSTPPPLLLYIYYFLVVVLFFYLVKRLGKKSTHNYDTTTTATKNPIQLRSSNRLIYEFFFWRKSALTRTKPFTTLSLLYLALYIKLQVPIIYLQTSSVTLFCLFVSAWLYIKWYGHKTCYIYIYSDGQKCDMFYIIIITYAIYYYYFLFFYPKVIVFCGYQAAPSFAPNIQRLIK